MPPRRQSKNYNYLRRPRNNFNGFDSINDDILGKILSKLPAKSLAYAFCVSHSWNRVSRAILSKPKLVTALSVEPSPMCAIKEAVKEALSKAIRPQFVIACFTMSYNLTVVHEYMKRRFGKSIPIITNLVEGVIGHDAQSQELTEITALEASHENETEDENRQQLDDSILPMFGLVLIVGWFPDMKVDAIPLIASTHQTRARTLGVEKFIDDIKKYSMEVADSPSPAAILLFGDKHAENRSQLLRKMDEEFTKETAIVGQFSQNFDYKSPNISRRVRLSNYRSLDGVALVIARDKNKDPGIGNTQFHVPFSRNVLQVGPTFFVDSISKIDHEKIITYFMAKNSTNGEILRGGSLSLVEGMTERIFMDDVYIGIEKKIATKVTNNRDKASTSAVAPLLPSKSISLRGLEPDKWDDLGSIIVNGEDINEGDFFKFYVTDFEKSLSMDGVIKNMNIQTQTQVFGGLIFTKMCSVIELMTRDILCFSTPFIDQFEDVPLGGAFTKCVVKRGSTLSAWKDNEEQQVDDCVTSHNGTSFLVMSFNPPHHRAPSVRS